MPPLHRKNINPGSTTESYLSLHHTAQALQESLSGSINIFLDSPNTRASSATPDSDPTILPCPATPADQPRANSSSLQSIPQGRAPGSCQHKPRQSKDRPGGNSKSVLQQPRPFGEPRKKVRRTYTREFKLQVLSFWLHHKTPIGPTTYRSPTVREVAARYLVPQSTIQQWRGEETINLIVDGTKGTRKAIGVRGCRWPEMENFLYQAYRARQGERKSVRRSWLRRAARAAFQKAYPTIDISIFVFSNGWFFGFLARHDITPWFANNKSQKIPADYLHACLEFIRFVRRNAQLRPYMQDELLVVGRYLLGCICNMDETPLPFEFLDGQTYADRGSHTVQV